MAYKKIKPYKYTEKELRDIWSNEYCNQPLTTFDGIIVKFFSSMFDHCFYESNNRKEKDKSILSLNRLEKIFWIKDTLLDSTSIRKKGWDRNTKSYTDSSRVNLVKDNYIVVIKIYSKNKARFITAYEVNNDENLNKIKNSPDWI
ncbi:MAG: hypothetical protein ABJQ39_04650 [Winogradskyella arenosi]